MLEKRVICQYPVRYLQDELQDITTGDFIMIAANTGTGKSTISRLFMESSIEQGCPVVLYSLEDQEGIPDANSVYQLVVKDGNYNMTFKQWLKDNTLHPEKYATYRQMAAEKAMRTNEDGLLMSVIHEQTPRTQWTLDKVISQIKEEVRQGYRLFILDHIDILVPSERPDDMVRAMRALWQVVCDNNIALITFSQLATRRNLDSLCPALDDLRGSKAKIHTPTVVISISRHIYGYYTLGGDPMYKPTYMRILKNRFGDTSCAVVFFYRGRYHEHYDIVNCNESGTNIDNMTSKDLMKRQKELII